MQYAIIIVLLIAFLLGGLVLYAGATSKLQTRFDLQDRIIDNVDSALEYGKSISSELEYNNTIELSLFENEIDRVLLTKKIWGAFNYFVAEVNHPNFNFTKSVLVGDYFSKGLYTLYLPDRGSGLALCGKTIIEGRVLIPEKGVKRAYIAGQNFEGEKLVDGKIDKSGRNMPEVDSRYLNQIQKPVMYEKLPWLNTDSISQSFKDLPKFFFSTGPITVTDCAVSGQVIIESTDSIFISNTAELDGIIVRAPIIHIEAGFEGTAQFIAGHKVHLGKKVVLKYPSVVAVFENNEFEQQSSIIVEKSAKIVGSVILHSSINNFRRDVFLDVQEKAQLHGLIYCQGMTQLNGEVSGTLITNKFYLKTKSSSYENHLLNAKIVGDLPAFFCVVPILEHSYKTTDIKCLK